MEKVKNEIVSHATIVISEVKGGRFIMRSSGSGDADEIAMGIMELIANTFEGNENITVTLENAAP